MPTSEPHSSEPRYPITEASRDPRFTWDLVRAVAAVLVWHGYPDPLASMRDASRLQSFLFRFLYLERRGGGER